MVVTNDSVHNAAQSREEKVNESFWKNHKIVLLSCGLIATGVIVLGSLGFSALLVSGVSLPNIALVGAVLANLILFPLRALGFAALWVSGIVNPNIALLGAMFSSPYFIVGCSSLGAGLVLGGVEMILRHRSRIT